MSCQRGVGFVLSVLVTLRITPLPVDAVVPSAQLEVALPRQSLASVSTVLCAPSSDAGWGPLLPIAKHATWSRLVTPTKQDAVTSSSSPSTNSDGCEAYSLSVDTRSTRQLQAQRQETLVSTAVVVDRGHCSFLTKAWRAQKAGAQALIVQGTKQAIYEAIQATNVSEEEENGRPVFEYDCSNGQAFVAAPSSPLWTTDSDGCRLNPKCASQQCVLTGNVDARQGGHQVCCLWDTFILMGANQTQAKNVTIPVVYITLAESARLNQALSENPEILVRPSRRPVSALDLSSVLLWAIGVATAVGAAYYSAVSDQSEDDVKTTTGRPSDAAKQAALQKEGQDTIEIDGRHAVMFIVLAGVFLVSFYYFKMAVVLPVLFAIAAIGAIAQVVLIPAISIALPSLQTTMLDLPLLEQKYSVVEVLGALLSVSIAMVWYTHRREFWFLQDAFGISLCFVFLRSIMLPNLRVATILLSLAFVYDIFFVFISPLVFGSSVMEDVATGGPAASTRQGYPGIDYCERYPSFPACEDPEPMPMLLVLPRMFDWVGGVSMLGLGDIILPGLLLSFVLRAESWPCLKGHGYFYAASIAYAVGLGMANLAVILLQIGQPALMYLVPMCLGATIITAMRNGDLDLLWSGLDEADEETSNQQDLKHWSNNQEHTPVRLHPGLDAEPQAQETAAVNDGGMHYDQAPLLGSAAPSPMV